MVIEDNINIKVFYGKDILLNTPRFISRKQHRKIIIKEDDKIVICIINGYKGIARCSPNDIFNRDTGIKLATHKCLSKMYSRSFKNIKSLIKKLDDKIIKFINISHDINNALLHHDTCILGIKRGKIN